MRTLVAIAVGVSIGVALVGPAGDIVLLCGLATAVITWFTVRRSPPESRRQTARAVAIAFAVIVILWLIAVVVALTAIPEDFNESF